MALRPLRGACRGRWLTRRGTQHFTRECVHYITSKGRAINHSFFPFSGPQPTQELPLQLVPPNSYNYHIWPEFLRAALDTVPLCVDIPLSSLRPKIRGSKPEYFLE